MGAVNMGVEVFAPVKLQPGLGLGFRGLVFRVQLRTADWRLLARACINSAFA
jgi:hypothetical protein